MEDFKQSSKQFTSDRPPALEPVLSWFDELNQPYIPQKVWLQCQLAIAEGFTNAVRHAHKNLPSEIPVNVEVSVSLHQLEIRIWDQGPPFDLEGKIQQLVKAGEHMGGSGRGILILRRIADELSYTRTDDDRNCLLIIKYY